MCSLFFNLIPWYELEHWIEYFLNC
jgi:hypothetical protein